MSSDGDRAACLQAEFFIQEKKRRPAPSVEPENP
jgi:hypothetical protein